MKKKIRLNSKRNQVYRVIGDNDKYISKGFSDIESLKREVKVNNILKQGACKVPDILKKEDRTVLYEDLGDITLLDWYEEEERKDSVNYSNMVYILANWMKEFYSATSKHYKDTYTINDINFRNFIVNNGEIYGIDFEQSKFGKIETDAGRLIAFALTYEPIMTEWKIVFSKILLNILIETLNIDKVVTIEERDRELREIEIRRGVKLDFTRIPG